MPAHKYLYIHNFGCQMNLHDSQRMAEVLGSAGYRTTNDPAAASLIVVNTCSVREKSRAKVFTALGRYSALKTGNSDLILAVAGCVAQQEGRRLLAAAPQVDIVLGPDHIADLARAVEQARAERQVRVGFRGAEDYVFLRAAPLPGQQSPFAFVTIQKGCDNGCSYCIVPLVRGPEVSRPESEVLREIGDLVAAGVREVTLIGQNVNAYRGAGGGEDDFVALLRDVDRTPGLERIRFTTSHPRDFTESLARCFSELERLCPWLHLPVQSGSTSMLERMNRGYSRDQYLRVIERVRALRPDISLGTDIIVAFPGETESQFEETVSLIEEVRYDYIYSFKYSMRPGTPAAALEDDVPEDEKSRRLSRLQAAQDAITRSRLRAFVGRTIPVIVEGPSRKGLPQLCGRTPGNQVVNFEVEEDDAAGPGCLVQVEVTGAGSHSLTGTVRRARGGKP